GQLEPSTVAVEHGREPPANAAVVKLRVGIGGERRENRLALLLAKPAEVELVVIAQEHAPLRRRWSRLGCLQCLDERSCVSGRKCVEQVLVDLKIEHHMHAVPVATEIFHVGFRQYVRLCQYDAVALSP